MFFSAKSHGFLPKWNEFCWYFSDYAIFCNYRNGCDHGHNLYWRCTSSGGDVFTFSKNIQSFEDLKTLEIFKGVENSWDDIIQICKGHAKGFIILEIIVWITLFYYETVKKHLLKSWNYFEIKKRTMNILFPTKGNLENEGDLFSACSNRTSVVWVIVLRIIIGCLILGSQSW